MTLGDPRTGAISTSNWAAKIPFDETRNYVTNGMNQLAAAHQEANGQDAAKVNPAQFAGTTGADGALPPVAAQVQPQASTASQLKEHLPSLMASARDYWLQLYPNDVVGADEVATRVASYGQLTIAAQQSQQDAAHETLVRGLIGAAPDGSQRATTMDQLLADPQMKAAWSTATPAVQMAVQDRLRQGDRTIDAQSMGIYYRLLGQAGNDPDGFAKEDLGAYFGKMPDNLLLSLMGQQKSAQAKDIAMQQKQVDLTHAMGVAETMVLRPAGIFILNKATPQSQRQSYDEFTGAFTSQLDNFRAQNKRPPSDAETIGIAKNLMTTVTLPGGAWGGFADKSIPAYAIDANNMGSVKLNVPPDFRAGITAAAAAKGKVPTERQMQAAYLIYLRGNPKQ